MQMACEYLNSDSPSLYSGWQAMLMNLGVVTRLVCFVPCRRALYPGHKVHFDENEKVGMFGCTHVIAVNGFSRKDVGLTALPKKNAVAIYQYLFRPLLIRRGIWDQVQVDFGREFDLILAVRAILAGQLHGNDRDMSPLFGRRRVTICERNVFGRN